MAYLIALYVAAVVAFLSFLYFTVQDIREAGDRARFRRIVRADKKRRRKQSAANCRSVRRYMWERKIGTKK